MLSVPLSGPMPAPPPLAFRPSLATASAATVIGASVMAGFHLDIEWLARPWPGTEYMRYSTAAGVLALGAATAALCARRRNAAAILALIAAFIGGGELGAAWLRVESPLHIAAPWVVAGLAGRMPVNASLALLAGSLAVGMLLWRRPAAAAAAAVLATTIGTIALSAGIGLALGLERAHTWDAVVGMAPPTTAALMLLAIALLLLAWTGDQSRASGQSVRWLPVAGAIGGLVLSVVLWLAVRESAAVSVKHVAWLVLAAGLTASLLLGTSLRLLSVARARAAAAEEAFDRSRQLESRLRLASAASNVGFWDWNLRKNTIFFSAQWKQQLGYGPGDLADELASWHERLHPEDRDRAVAAVNGYLAAGAGPYECEFRLRHRDGSYRWILARGDLERDTNGMPLHFRGCHVDVTERKAVEATLLLANEALARQSVELRSRSEESEAFMYSISHDLRAPLVNLQGFASELDRSCRELRELDPGVAEALQRLRAIVTDEIPGALHYIVASANRFERLINGLLALSRSGRQEFHAEKLAMADVVRATVDSVYQQARERHATVEVLPLPNALGDPSAVPQIVANLLTNSLKYLDATRPGRIEIGGERQDGVSHYWVRDNGVGIPPGARDRLFQPFQRFHQELAEGDGMGLAIVKRLVERHAGRLWAESVEGQGTTMHFTLTAEA